MPIHILELSIEVTAHTDTEAKEKALVSARAKAIGLLTSKSPF